MKNDFIPFFWKWRIILVAILLVGCNEKPFDASKFYDYQDGISYAKKVNKPVLIVFSAYIVGNNEFDRYYFESGQISNFLNRNFIIIEMIVDDRKTVSDAYKNSMLDKFNIQIERGKIKNLGHLNTAIQRSEYKANSQPLYVVLDTQEQLLMEPFGYQGSSSKFYNKLQLALANFKKAR